MGTFSCSKCGALVDLLYVNRHVCGAKGPAGGYSRRPDGREEMDAPDLLMEHLAEFQSAVTASADGNVPKAALDGVGSPDSAGRKSARSPVVGPDSR